MFCLPLSLAVEELFNWKWKEVKYSKYTVQQKYNKEKIRIP